jgi:AcrR family transcriptional regulator
MSKNLYPTDDTRDRILKAAANIMARRGYARATTRAIAEAAGVNEVTLFRHFGNKRNLLSEMIQKHSALPNLTFIIEKQLTGDYRQDLIHLATVFFRVITEREEALRLMLCEAKEFPEVQDVVVKVPDKLRGMLTRYFQEKIDTGSLRKVNPEVMAQGFLGMFFSYGIARAILGSNIAPEVPQEDIITEFVDIFVQGTLR